MAENKNLWDKIDIEKGLDNNYKERSKIAEKETKLLSKIIDYEIAYLGVSVPQDKNSKAWSKAMDKRNKLLSKIIDYKIKLLPLMISALPDHLFESGVAQYVLTGQGTIQDVLNMLPKDNYKDVKFSDGLYH